MPGELTDDALENKLFTRNGVKQGTTERLDAACERALLINAIAYSSVTAILKAGLDRASSAEPAKPTPQQHANIRGSTYYQ